MGFAQRHAHTLHDVATYCWTADDDSQHQQAEDWCLDAKLNVMAFYNEQLCAAWSICIRFTLQEKRKHTKN